MKSESCVNVCVLQEIEAAIKAYPFRQPRDEQAALEAMSAIVRDLENGNIKSREELHKVRDFIVLFHIPTNLTRVLLT